MLVKKDVLIKVRFGKAMKNNGKMGMKYLPLRFSMKGLPTEHQSEYMAVANAMLIKMPTDIILNFIVFENPRHRVISTI